MDNASCRSSLSGSSNRRSLSLESKHDDESDIAAGQHFDQMLGSDHRQTIAAVSQLAAYMSRTGKGINHIFKDLDSSGDGKLSHQELERALVELDINITTVQAHALVTFMDNDGDGEIDVKELDSTIRLYKRRKRAGELSTWRGNLDAQQDPVFPNWLIGRDDFQKVFSRQAKNSESTHGDRFSEEDGAYGVPEIKKALQKQPEERLHRDVQAITGWLGQQDSLRSLGAKRLMEVTNVVECQELRPGEKLFSEGDESEAFYMILDGHVVVLVKQCPVAVLGPGETFGELGLQNLEKRTATVKADPSGALLVTMRTSDYRHILSKYLMDKMQMKINLLQDTFELAKNWSHSKIRAFAYCMAHHSHAKGEYIYRQGEPAHNLYIVQVLAQRVLRYRFVNRWPVSNKKTHQRNSMKQARTRPNHYSYPCSMYFLRQCPLLKVTINLKTLTVGEVTGEDCVLGFETRQYQVVALSQDVQVCVVSRHNAFLYLTSGELDQLYNQTQQDLYRYAGDSNTSYYKAVKGWQDASKMKNEVGGPLYRNRLEASERQARMPRGSKNSRRHKHVREQASKRAVKGGPGSKSLQSTSSSAPTLPARKPAKDGGGSRLQSSRSHSTLPTPGSAPGELSRKESALKFPLIESGRSIR
ncbi:unnamed protein product [Ectocarpus sp. 6 AP-2014]